MDWLIRKKGTPCPKALEARVLHRMTIMMKFASYWGLFDIGRNCKTDWFNVIDLCYFSAFRNQD